MAAVVAELIVVAAVVVVVGVHDTDYHPVH
jgi:hypothetical protein